MYSIYKVKGFMYIFLLIFVKEYHNLGASLVAQCKPKRKIKVCLQMKEMWIRSPGGEDALEKGMASFLENPMDRGAWRATVHTVAKSWTRLKRLSVNAYMI